MTTTYTADAVHLDGDGPIIMVDDSVDDFYIANLMYARCELENEFIHFESGDALLRFLEDRTDETGLRPALILMDLNMPGMDGIETTAALRAQTEFKSVPVIAILTSSTDRHDRRRAESAGASAYYSKPLSPTGYIELFNSFAAR